MTPPSGRIIAVDLARTGALLAMVVFHATYDLALFGHLPADTVFTGIWPYWARGTAGSFLFLAGVSLWLGHGHGIRWGSFGKRLGVLVAAATAVSVGTFYGLGAGWIRFGILHSIALCSVIGLGFLRVPGLVTLGVAVAVFMAPSYLRDVAFNGPGWIWLGLGTERPPMADYEPVLPWLAPFLGGLGLAKLYGGRWDAWRGRMAGLAWLAWPGQHSLVIYLAHQPLLIGLIWAGSRVFGG